MDEQLLWRDMTTAEQLAARSTSLSRSLVSHGRFRWMPGMRATHRFTGYIRVLVTDDGDESESHIVRPGCDGNEVQTPVEWSILGQFPGEYDSPMLPDLDDCATQGCLWAMLCEDLPTGWGADQGVDKACGHGVDMGDGVEHWRSVDGDFGPLPDDAPLSEHVATALLWLWGRLDG